MKKEFNNNMESLKKRELNRNPGNKKSIKSIKNTIESHSSRLEQVEDRITGFEDKIVIKEKVEKFLDKNTKELRKDYEKLCSVEGPNLRTMCIEEGKEVQAKGICNMFNKIIADNFPNLKKIMFIQ
jgi:hypothetical protein